MKPNKRSIIPLTVAAAMLISLGSGHAATTLSAHSRHVASNAFVSTAGLVGRGNGAITSTTIVVFSVQEILTNIQILNPSFMVADLATSDFVLSFDTIGNIQVLPVDGTYTVNYLGFVANADVAPTTFWSGSYRPLTHWNPTTSPSTGVSDTLANQTGITSTSFNLTGITESDTSNDYVVFGIGYSQLGPTNFARDTIANITLTLIPEPTTALLGSLGMLFLLRRRR